MNKCAEFNEKSTRKGNYEKCENRKTKENPKGDGEKR